MEQLDAGVFLVHRGEHGDAVLLLHGLADLSARRAVASGVEGRARDEDIELLAFEHPHDALQGLVGTRRHEVVAADDGVRHLDVLGEGVEYLGAPDGSGADFGLVVGHILAAHLPEELVDVMNRLEHAASSLSSSGR